jgi:hypothetical protein
MAMTVPEIQRLVEQLRHQARNPRLADQMLLLNLLGQYGEVCEAVNVRLRACGQLLNRGLRSEAIQLAEQVPSVLDTVQLLDCPELPILEEMLASQGMALPPGILFESASQLNAAYHEERQLAPLLREYRLLALSRAPLKMRLRLLRRIGKQDPASMFWQEDQRLFEQERQMQLQREVSDAGKAGNLAVLAELRQELASEEWLVKPPVELLHLTARNIARCEQVAAQQQLPDLIEQLEAFYQEQNYASAGQLAEVWQHVAQKAGLKPDHPLQLRYDVVYRWLAAEQQRQAAAAQQEQAIRGLEQAVAKTASSAELQQHYEHLWHGGIPLRDELRERVELRVAVLRAREKRRTILRVAAVLMIALLLAGGAGWYLQQRTYQASLTAATDNLQKFLTEQDYEQAEKYLENLRSTLPAIAAEQRVQTLEQQLAKENSAERTRVTDLQAQWDALEKSGPQDYEPYRLQQAETLVKTAAEKQQLQQWQQRVAAAKENKQQASDSAFAKELDELREQVEKFVLAPLANDFLAAEKDFNALRNSLRQLHKTPRISPALLDELPPLEARLSTRWQDWEQQRRMESELPQWLVVSSDAERYARTLTEFSQRFPDTARGKAAGEVANEVSLWSGSDAWLSLLNNKELYANALNSGEAKNLLERGQRNLDQYPKHPLAEEYSKHQPRLEAIVARVKSDAKSMITEDLQTLFRDPVFTDLQMLEMNNGVRYYLTKQLAEKMRFDFWREGPARKIRLLDECDRLESQLLGRQGQCDRLWRGQAL